ncbi:MAG: enoyl-CoA hydratase/isomerase family protein [bacterium]
MDFTRIKYTTRRRVCRIELSRPEKQNALDPSMIAELSSALTFAQRDSEVKVIILAGEGDTFCIGSDLDHLHQSSTFDFNQNQEDSANLMKLFQQMYTHRKPVICVVRGEALQNGCGLVVVSDFVIASKETAKFGLTEVKQGFIPALLLLFLVRRTGESKARELALSGNVLNAEEALKIGIVNFIIPDTQLEQFAMEFSRSIVEECSSSSLSLIKELLSRFHGMSTADALNYASNLNALTRMTEDCKKGVEAILNNESAKW